MKQLKPEILAPAGSMEALRAAVYAGADAIYLGGEHFGARAYANNFNTKELITAIEYSHLYGVKVYLTINTLFHNDEIEKLYDYLLPFYEAGLDAVIVQDLGVMYYVHEHFPDLPIHASTQMTITTEYAYSLLAEYGVTRIVPARELSLAEIAQLKEGDITPELEVFVQGALCYCYSGQCLMSSMLGGRSGNRGRCAQTCRLPYTVFDENERKIAAEGSYVLSPKDLCGLETIPELIEAGVDSFKIEGRMKRPEYVAVCVEAYRKIVDAYVEGRFSKQLVECCKKEMAEIFNRGGFTKGYYHQKNGKNMMSVKYPGNIGVEIGTLIAVKKNQVIIQLKENVSKGDLLVVKTKKEEITLTCNQALKSGERLTLNAPKTGEILLRQNIFRKMNAPLICKFGEYSEQEKRIILEGKVRLKTGFPATFTIQTKIKGREYSVVWEGAKVEQAQNNPLSVEVVREKIEKTGNTRYQFSKLEIEISGNVFYSLKALKELRRQAIEALEQEILSAEKRTVKEKKKLEQIKAYMLENEQSNVFRQTTAAMVSTIEQYQLVKKEEQITDIYLDLQYLSEEDVWQCVEKDEEEKLFLVLPPILRQHFFGELKAIIKLWQENSLKNKGIVVRNIDELAYLKQIGYAGEVVTDYSLYAMNDYAAFVIRQHFSKSRITIPVELNQKQIKSLGYTNTKAELEVYGYQQLMVSTQCLQNTMKKCDRENHWFRMSDRYDKSFFVRCICKYCYNLIYNGVPTVLFDLVSKQVQSPFGLRIHFTKECSKEVQTVLDAYFGQKAMESEKTRGHFNRGVE